MIKIKKKSDRLQQEKKFLGTTSSHQSGQIRIISGKWRGRKIIVPLTTHHIRPTTDRTKETLFNWLAPIISGASCLDAFAGSGALGIEALSRNAKQVTFIEKDQQAVHALKKTLIQLNSTANSVVNADALKWLQVCQPQRFSVIFLDPPFYQNLLPPAVRFLEERGWLAEDAWIYLESEVTDNIEYAPSNWTLYRQKKTNTVVYTIFIRT